MATKNAASSVFSLASLGFSSVWLLGWTVGVSVIQLILLAGGIPFLLIFLASHGGAEVYVLRETAGKIRETAELPSVQPDLQLDHDGLRARWPNGNGSLLLAGGASALGLVIHAALFASLYAGLYDGIGFMELVFVPLMTLVWSFTGFQFATAVWTHLQQRGEVVLDADLDEVAVSYEGAFVQQSVRLPLHELEVDDAELEQGRLVLRAGDEEAVLRIAEGPQSRELVELLRTMTGRATQGETPKMPRALEQLRGQG